jgi:hypothetical protein
MSAGEKQNNNISMSYSNTNLSKINESLTLGFTENVHSDE